MSKQKYYSDFTSKFRMTRKSSNILWSILKLFLNDGKIPIIPVLFHENKFVTDFKELLNVFSAKQC